MEAAYFIWTVFLGAMLVYATARGREPWPFSHYPMFAAARPPDSAERLIVAAVRSGGAREPWRSAWRGEEKSLSWLLARAARSPLADAQLRWHLARILPRFADPATIERLEIVRRRGTVGGDGSISLHEDVVFGAAAATLRGGDGRSGRPSPVA